MPRVSVQVPLFNDEAHIACCLDSILAQTEQDFEVLCVDDGSTDGSAAVVQEYVRRDPRIHLTRQPRNLGTLQARRKVFELARGDYMLFVDSDDFIAPSMMADLLAAAEGSGAELLQCGAEIYDPDEVLPPGVRRSYGDYFGNVPEDDGGQTLPFEALGRGIKHNLCLSFISRSVYERLPGDIPSDPLPHGNDNFTVFLIAYYARSWRTLDIRPYFYRAGQNSSNLNRLSRELLEAHMQSRARLIQLVEDFRRGKVPEVGWSEHPFCHLLESTRRYVERLIERCDTGNPATVEALRAQWKEQFTFPWMDEDGRWQSGATETKPLTRAWQALWDGDYSRAVLLMNKASREFPDLAGVIEGNRRILEHQVQNQRSL